MWGYEDVSHDCVSRFLFELGVVHYNVQPQTIPSRIIYSAAPTFCFEFSVFPVSWILVFTYKSARPTCRTRCAPLSFRLQLPSKRVCFRFGLFPSSLFCDKIEYK